MDARNTMQRIGAILVIVAGACGDAVYASHIHIYSSDFNLPIPSPNDPQSKYGRGLMDDAIIEVPDHLVISDLDVGVTLTHESLFDLQILLLRSPTQENVLLNPAGNLAFIVRGKDGRLTAYGGSVQWLFDDEAGVSIEQATKPYTGLYQPVEHLSSFWGEDAFGFWRLRIYDAFYADVGTLNNFELVITSPEPATAVFLTLGFGLMTLLNQRRKQ